MVPRHETSGVRRGFTLVELLVVIAIIGVLVALLLPAVQAAREAARKTQCQNNLKQLVLAVHNYVDSNQGQLPPGGITDGPCCSHPSGTSWSISILPFHEEQGLYDLYDFTAYNEDPVNAPVVQSHVAVQKCPSDANTDTLNAPHSGPGAGQQYARGSYRANTGRCSDLPYTMWDSPSETGPGPAEWKGPFHAVAPTATEPSPESYQHVRDIPRLGSIIDGTSNTLFIGESMTNPSSPAAERRATFWAYSYTSYNKSCVIPQTRTLLTDYDRCIEVGGTAGENPCKRAWGSFHPAGILFAYGDASVRSVSFSIDMEIFASMATHAGGEIPLYK